MGSKEGQGIGYGNCSFLFRQFSEVLMPEEQNEVFFSCTIADLGV